MSIKSEIDRITGNIASAYAAVGEKGVELPEERNSENLAEAVAKIQTGDVSSGGIPSGCILIWSGAADTVPDGWHLCDGTDNTPDLRDRFVLGAGGKYVVNDTGGEEEHTLVINELPAHYHSYQKYAMTASLVYTAQTTSTKVNSYYNNATNTGSVGGSKSHNNMPPYYALCYIMKL